MQETRPRQTRLPEARVRRRLSYFQDPLDALGHGEVFTGGRERSCVVRDGLAQSTQVHHWLQGTVTVMLKHRFLLVCKMWWSRGRG